MQNIIQISRLYKNHKLLQVISVPYQANYQSHEPTEFRPSFIREFSQPLTLWEVNVSLLHSVTCSRFSFLVTLTMIFIAGSKVLSGFRVQLGHRHYQESTL